MDNFASQLVEFLQIYRLYFVVAFLCFLGLAFETGLRLGLKRKRDLGDNSDEGVSLVIGSMLGLLASVLALNLSTASSRFDMRNNAALTEVNAIGTALLQAQAVGGNQGGELVTALKEYLLVRYNYIRANNFTGEIEKADARTAELQNDIWGLVSARVNENSSAAVTSLMNSVNTAFDASTSLRQAMEFKMPLQFILLLLAMSMLGSSAVGYQFGLHNRRGRMPGIVLSVLWCMIVTEILDIGSARMWTFRAESRVYEWSMQSLGIEVPGAVK